MLLTIHLFENTSLLAKYQGGGRKGKKSKERERRARRGEEGEKGEKKKKRRRFGDARFIHGEEEQQNSKKEQHSVDGRKKTFY